MTNNDSGFSDVVGWHNIGHGIKWRYYRHWGQNCHAGEGQEIFKGDRSGCLIKNGWKGMDVCLRPRVFLAREYFKGKNRVSAVLSYPDGLSIIKRYFWEIYPTKTGDIERFFSEAKMERAVKQILVGAKSRKGSRSTKNREGVKR